MVFFFTSVEFDLQIKRYLCERFEFYGTWIYCPICTLSDLKDKILKLMF